MTFDLIIPGLATVALGVVAGHVRWALKPAVAVKVLSLVAAVAAATVLLIAGVVALAFAARWSLILVVVQSCPAIPLHHQVGFVEGAASFIIVTVAAIRIRQVVRQRRWAVEGTTGRRVSVLADDEPIAYAAPGKPGCVVVSRGLLTALEPRERQVVFAHERAHLEQNHHRYLLAGALSVAVLPILRPLVDQVRLATERCADEAAATAMAGDREVVASAIARAALATHAYHEVVASFGGASIPIRVEALIATPSSRIPTGVAAAAVAAAAGVGLAAGSVQIHHFIQLVGHLCGL